MTALLFSVTSAFAAPYKYEKAQSEELSKTVPGGAFQEPYGLAFDSAGNLFAADAAVPFPGENKVGAIDIFDSSNVFSSQIDDATVSPENPFTGAYVRSVTVDNLPGPDQGMVYVGESNHEVVDVFKPEGSGKYKLVQERRFPENYVTVAFDNSTGPNADKLYVLEKAKLVLVTLNADGTLPESEMEPGVKPLEAPTGPHVFGNGQDGSVLAVGPTGKLYLANPEEKVVDVYSNEDVLEAPLTGPPSSKGFKEPIAVAVDGATGNVFVADKEGFGEGTARTDAVDELGPSGKFINQIAETGANELFGELKGVAVQQAGPHAGDVYVSDAKDRTVDVFAEEVPTAPLIEGEGAQQVTGDSASFVGEINPRGAPTEYHFEYGPCSGVESCASSSYPITVPVPDGALGAEDFTAHTTPSFHVQGLSAGTTYHFRVVAHNEVNGKVEVGEGEERTFTTHGAGGEFGVGGFPDNRAWELVSPPDKHGGVLSKLAELGVTQAAVGGGAISYLANAPTEAGSQGDAGEVQVLSTRTSSGWASRDIATPHQAATGDTPGTSPEYRFFNEDLSSAVVQPFGRFNPALSDEASEQTPYLHALGSCESSCFTPLVTGEAGFADVPTGTKFGEELLCEENNGAFTGATTVCGPQFQGATPDASHVVLRSAAPLVAGVPRDELYEWSGGQLKLVSVLPENQEGKELPAPTEAGLGEQPLLGTLFGVHGKPGTARRAISNEGTRVFWESGEKLYVRDTAIDKSLQIDAPEVGCPQGTGEHECEGGGARFQIASSDGSRVYFTDERRLTKDAGAGYEAPDLYECRVVEAAGRLACQLEDLTPSEGGESADVQGDVLGAGEGNGSAIYFVADGTLAGSGLQRGTCRNDSENPQPEGATCNLYVRREGQRTKLVATLSGADAKDWTRHPEHQPTRVSPDGQWLSFMSQQSLTGDDNHDAVSGKLDAEVFLYDAAGAGSLSCASCDPSGGRPVGVEYGKLESGQSEALPAVREEWEDSGWVAALPPHTSAFGVVEPGRQPDYLSDSGRLFFNGLDALVPQDVNGTGDVYEFEPLGYVNVEGTEQCSETTPTFASRSGGCIGLISSGTSAQSSSFLDASASGGDVFFLTTSKLTPEDIDTKKDVYDAHECTVKSPCIPPAAAAPPPCNTEASCKPSPTPPPSIFGAPPSATFNGAGNLTPPAVVKPKAKPLTRAQKLAKALAVCHREKKKARRKACEASARRKYRAAKRARTKGK